jgi:membrane protease YdiL (CAAX protease family)
MTTSGLLIAAGAVSVGLLAWALRPKTEPLLPRWKPWRVPWSGLEVILAFLAISLVLPVTALELLTKSGFFQEVYGPNFPLPGAKDVTAEQLKEASTIRLLWANLFTLPIVLGGLWFAARAFYPKWKPAIVGSGSLAGKVSLAVGAWLVIAPVVLVFNVIVNVVAQLLNVPPETHALTKLASHPPVDQALFAFEACVAAPLREEILFRGILLAWCARRMNLPGAGVGAITATRPWFVMTSAVALAQVMSEHRAAPVIFAGVLAIGLGVLWCFPRPGARRARAIYATAALFAVVHTNVWPSPIPLFVLGLGLGWLAVRTNGVLVPVIVHGLFNAVSVVFVLRGS